MADGDGAALATARPARERRRRTAAQGCMGSRTACAGCRVRRVAVCAALDDAELPDLESIMVHRCRVQGHMLMLEGDPADHVFSIVSGGVKLYKSLPDGRQQIVACLLPGDCLTPPDSGGYVFSAEALTETEFCEFPRGAFDRVVRKYEKLKRHMQRIACDELAAAHEHMLVLGRKNALERLCSFLVDLRARTAQWGGPTDPLHVPLQRTEIADYLGLSMETVSRAFSRMRALGLIRIPARPEEICIVDLPRVEAIANGGVRREPGTARPRAVTDGEAAPGTVPVFPDAGIARPCCGSAADTHPCVWRPAAPFF